MLKTIIIREIQEYIKSKKFLIGLLITLVLVTVTTIINIEDDANLRQDYLDAKSEMGKNNVFRPPQVLSILAVGKDQTLGNRAEVSSGRIDVKTTGYMGKYESLHNRYLSGFMRIDFAFVVRVVFSVMVIFMGYNAVSAEKVNGTLKLMLANNLPRDQVLLGKSVGGLLTIIVSLVFASLVSVLILLFHPSVSLTPADWYLIAGMIGASILYLAVFYLISLLVSVLINTPSTCLMVLLQLWIFLVIIYPTIGVFLADKSYKMPGDTEIQRNKRAAAKPYVDEGNKLYREYSKKNPDHRNWDYDDPLLLKRAEAYNTAAEIKYRIDRDITNELKRQAELAQTIALLSPAVLYDRVVLRYSRTDLKESESFIDGIFINWKMYRQFTDDGMKRRDMMKNMPEFIYQSQTVLERFRSTFADTAALFTFTVLLFLLTYTAFLKKDVR